MKCCIISVTDLWPTEKTNNNINIVCFTDVIYPQLVTSVLRLAAPMFWVPNRLNKLLEMHFKFPLNLTGKSTMTFLTNRPFMVHNQILEDRWGQEQGFQHCFANGLNKKIQFHQWCRLQWHCKDGNEKKGKWERNQTLLEENGGINNKSMSSHKCTSLPLHYMYDSPCLYAVCSQMARSTALCAQNIVSHIFLFRTLPMAMFY